MNEILSAGLIGSVVGIILKSIFDIVEKKQEHRYQRQNITQKDLFDKKIKIAEAAVAQFTQLKLGIHAMIEVLDMLVYILKGDIPFDEDAFNNTIKEIGPIIERAKTYDTASMSLYFDIKEFTGDQYLLQDLYSTVSTLMKSLDNSIDEDMTKITAILLKLLMIVSKLLKSVEDNIAENIQIIKSDMKELKAI